MLTVRTIGIHGDEVVFQAAYVVHGSDARHTNDRSTQVEFYDSGHLWVRPPAHFGRVFVMNENGKTVATYELGETPGKQE